MKKIIITTTILTLFLFIPKPLLAAHDVEIILDVQPFFSVGNKVSFSYTTRSTQALEITYAPRIICPNAPAVVLEPKTIQLEPNQPFTDTYQDITITQDLEPQTCTASVEILSPIRKKAEKQFEIKTDPSFDLKVKFCQDQACQQLSKVYVMGDLIYIDYESNIDQPSILASLTDPDGLKTDINLPAKIQLDKTGEYELKLEASQSGYKINHQSETIVVLKEKPRATDQRICNADGQCGGQENFQNCPQDCQAASGQPVSKKNYTNTFFLLIGLVMLLLIIVVFIFIKPIAKDKNKI